MNNMMRSGLFSMAAGLFLAAAIPGVCAAGEPALQAGALRGIPAFQVKVHDNRQVKAGYLVGSELKEALVKRLKSAGIAVGGGKPCIIDARVDGGPAGDGHQVVYTFTFTVQLRGVSLRHLEEAAHMGDKVAVIPNERYLDLIDDARWLTVWQVSRLGVAAGSGLQDALLGDLEKMAAKLIVDYWRVNGAE